MSTKAYLLVSGTLFSIVSAAHLLRILYRLPVMLEVYALPMYLSWIGLVVPALLAAWAFRLAHSCDQP